ncbi:MAG: efflux RND transporter periplasmic adaptor subunit [Pseudomonadota bacterium]
MMQVRGFLSCGAVGVMLLAGCEQQVAEQPEIVRPVRAIQIGAADAVNSRWFPGRAQATQEADLAFEVAGRVIERPIDVGDQVETGQTLIALDPRDFQNDLDAAEGEQERAQAQRDRVQQAAQTGAVSQQDLTDAEADLRIAQSEVRIRKKALEDTKLAAPFDGVIAAIFVENFENIQAKENVLRMLDTSKIEMIVDIPESGIVLAPYVEDVRVRFDVFPDREFPAAIKEIGSEASRDTRTFPVTVIMDQPDDAQILPGMAGQATGTVNLPDDIVEQGFEVPLDALFTEPDGGTYVWVVDPATGVLSRREVEKGPIAPIGVVVTGLELGEWVLTAGVNSVTDGQQVRLLDQAPPQS